MTKKVLSYIVIATIIAAGVLPVISAQTNDSDPSVQETKGKKEAEKGRVSLGASGETSESESSPVVKKIAKKLGLAPDQIVELKGNVGPSPFVDLGQFSPFASSSFQCDFDACTCRGSDDCADLFHTGLCKGWSRCWLPPWNTPVCACSRR